MTKKMPGLNMNPPKQEQELKEVEETENNIEDQEAETKIEDNENVKKITKLQQKNAELEKKLMYLAAEYDNLRKRSQSEIEDARKFAISKFAGDVVKIYDVLLTALDNVDTKNTDKTLYEGIKMTTGEFEKAFEKIGVIKINPKEGEMFDHNKHEAIARVQSDLPIGAITKVIRAGYELNGRLLRATMVIVSAGK